MTNVLARAASIRRKSSSSSSSNNNEKENINQSTNVNNNNNNSSYTTQSSKKYFNYKNYTYNNNNNSTNKNDNNNNNITLNHDQNQKSNNNQISSNNNSNTNQKTPPSKLVKSKFPPPPPTPISPTQLLRSSPSLTDCSPPPPLPISRTSRSSSSPISLNSMKSSTSLSTINSTNNNNNNDKLIKTLLKRYKKLELALNKFNSRKYNHTYNTNNSNNGAILKGNLLRTSLIPFLRSTNQLDQFFNKDSKIYKSLTSVILAVLIKWWNSLIGNLKYTINSTKPNPNIISSINHSELIHYTNIPASDRNAYLECVSRIISREDWHLYDDQNDYQTLLTTTLDYCIDKLSTLKTLTGSMAAFVGKVFAYSFFKIPNVSNALLFLLNVKQINLENSLKILPDINQQEKNENLNIVKSKFPKHLHHLLNFKGLQNLTTRGQKCYMNCTPPPKHPVDGIKNPNGDWVRRWCGSDSNVFNSFFRHYVEIIRRKFIDNVDNNLLLICPGFSIIFSHIYQIFKIAVTRITANMKNSKEIISSFNLNIKQSDMYYSSIIKIFKTIRDITYVATRDQNLDNISANLVKIIDLCFISIAKETTIYDFNKNGIILGILNEFVNHIDFNSCNNEVQYLINWEFWLSCNYMMINHCDHIQSLLKNFAFLFNVWDMIPDVLSSFISNSTRSNSTNASIDDVNYKWITNIEESFKLNFINYLISDEQFEKFFIHWNPLVRSYYIKLLIWRVIGINNYQSSFSIQTTRKLQSKLDQSFEILSNYTIANNGKLELNFKPDNPLVNRKFSILPISAKDDYLSISGDGITGMNSQSEVYLSATSLKSSELRKTHPYEVFDEAIYTCATVPPINETNNNNTSSAQPTASPPPKNNSIVTSIGKLLKILSDEENNQDKFPQPPIKHSESSSSLSTSSYKSRSSSPSIMSFKSTPTSITETSSVKSEDYDEASSILTIDTLKLKDDSDLSSQKNQQQNYNIQPPELSKLPPEIIRPVFKFDIIVCHESMNEKYQIINYKNSLVNQSYFNGFHQQQQQQQQHYHHHYYNNVNGNNPQYHHYNQQHQQMSTTNFPNNPQLPYMSLFVNSDIYGHKFYLNEEDDDGIFIEELTTQDEEELNKQQQRQQQQKNSIFNTTNANDGKNLIQMINLGKSINELNYIIQEFKNFLKNRIEIDNQKFETFLTQKTISSMSNLNLNSSNNSKSGSSGDTLKNNSLNFIDDNFNEFIYFKRIIPFLSVDSSNEMRLLNAN
ncbi:hypothetical protein KGF54_003518 [Candida jiufengensis]|uniref:uncharacterized protein n=1 Tax=Candida jiufengensis TaxID=497108 RepID=UPI002225946C|nr:uncharacterized protein KGF54_003518 [Candida jiufengensis]KAI5952651.1 hypothetical protein KGF54_003518 [Candida jiufengensis]